MIHRILEWRLSRRVGIPALLGVTVLAAPPQGTRTMESRDNNPSTPFRAITSPRQLAAILPIDHRWSAALLRSHVERIRTTDCDDAFWDADNTVSCTDNSDGTTYFFSRDSDQPTDVDIYVNESYQSTVLVGWDGTAGAAHPQANAGHQFTASTARARLSQVSSWSYTDGTNWVTANVNGDVQDTSEGWDPNCVCPPEPETCLPCPPSPARGPEVRVGDLDPSDLAAVQIMFNCEDEQQTMQTAAWEAVAVGGVALAVAYSPFNPVGAAVTFSFKTGWAIGKLILWGACKAS